MPQILDAITANAVQFLEAGGERRTPRQEAIQREDSESRLHGMTPLSVISWIALAVVSGVIGNFSYEKIKELVFRARRAVNERKPPANTSTQSGLALCDLKQEDFTVMRELDALSDEELSKRAQVVYEYALQRLGKSFRDGGSCRGSGQ